MPSQRHPHRLETEAEELRLPGALPRSVLWFACLLAAIALFSVVWGREIFSGVFRVTAILALPVGLLFLPAVLRFGRLKTEPILWVLLGGASVGPVAMVIWSLLLIGSGSPAHEVWHGDPEVGFGIGGTMLCAAIVGLLSTGFYLLALQSLRFLRKPR